MKKLQKGFTLVELIVVITILAILGTIAFISLQGYSQDAKNAKVNQDLATLGSAIEIANTDGTLSGFDALIDQSGDGATFATNNVVTGNITIFDNSNASSTGAIASASTYDVGILDFAAIRQSGGDFKDSSGNEYVAAVAYSGATAYYQLAGQTKGATDFTAVVKGNYVAQTGDVDGLISNSAVGTTTGIESGDNLGTATADINLY